MYTPKVPMPSSIIAAISLISGELTKNATLTPNGTPAATKPINSGIDEHEQKGVTTPKNTARKYPAQRDFPDRYSLTLSGLNWERKSDITNIKT